jgi:beta-phosphoglucomutase-like phosphatase (HAD superfamily)
MGVSASQCVVVEDSPTGIAAARSAGMACIGFAQLTPSNKLAAPGVTVCRSMKEVSRELRRYGRRGNDSGCPATTRE